ncbi:MAG: xanthine dehydrogenase family protein subunit M, partial [Planctomycetota bacterium]
HDARIAAGSVAPTPLRLREAEKACEAKPANRETARAAAALARDSVTPIDDVRSTAEYRSFVLERVVGQLLMEVAGAGPRA